MPAAARRPSSTNCTSGTFTPPARSTPLSIGSTTWSTSASPPSSHAGRGVSRARETGATTGSSRSRFRKATAARLRFKRFVDACHRRGLAVILDVVYNHLGPEGNVLALFGPYFTDVYSTPWGSAVNVCESGSDEVRRYFTENAVMWLSDFHVDGLRLDAIHGIIDPTASPFLRESHRGGGGPVRRARPTPRRSSPRARTTTRWSCSSADVGGLGFDASGMMTSTTRSMVGEVEQVLIGGDRRVHEREDVVRGLRRRLGHHRRPALQRRRPRLALLLLLQAPATSASAATPATASAARGRTRLDPERITRTDLISHPSGHVNPPRLPDDIGMMQVKHKMITLLTVNVLPPAEGPGSVPRPWPCPDRHEVGILRCEHRGDA